MEFLKDILGEDLYGQVAEKLNGNDKVRIVNAADGSWLPKAKFDEERANSKTLKGQITDLNTQLEAMKTGAADAETLKAQVAKMQADIAAKDAEMKQQALSYRIKDAVRGSKARNADIIMKMLDVSKVSEDNGNLIGLDAQIEALRKSDAYLFEDEKPANGGVPSGREPGGAPTSSNYAINQAIRQAVGQ